MKTEQSNVQITSNICSVNVTGNRIDLNSSLQFMSWITDRDALRRLVDIIHPGLISDEQRVNLARAIPGLSEWQAKRVGIADECAHPLAPRGEKQWGVSTVNGKLKYICRCSIRSCPEFEKCRPDEVNNVTRD